MKKRNYILLLTILLLMLCATGTRGQAAEAAAVKQVQLCVDCSQKLPAKIKGAVKWKSNKPSVVSVSKGKITGKSVGTAVIKAYNGKHSQTWKVTVLKTIRQGNCGKYGNNTKWKLSKNGTLFITGAGMTASYLKYGSIVPYFSVRSMITRIVISEGVKTIGNGMFANCKNLKTVSFPDSMRNIGKKAFSGCRKLKSVYITPSLKKIHSSAFSGCRKLKTFILGNKTINVKSYLNTLTKRVNASSTSLWNKLRNVKK